MNDGNLINDEVLQRAQELIEEMRSGNNERAVRLFDDLVRIRETSLFHELGKLTREFHNALTSFRLDSRISSLANDDIPDARDRLNHVITMTNDAADRTLNAVEESLPLCEKLSSSAIQLKTDWDRFQNRQMQADEFRILCRQLSEFLGTTVDISSVLRSSLNEVLMAQDFQDLTGQIIKRVITLVEEVENNLINLIKLSSQKVAPDSEEVKTEKTEAAFSELEGPQVPGRESTDAVSGQDEVDGLLSSLGF